MSRALRATLLVLIGAVAALAITAAVSGRLRGELFAATSSASRGFGETRWTDHDTIDVGEHDIVPRSVLWAPAVPLVGDPASSTIPPAWWPGGRGDGIDLYEPCHSPDGTTIVFVRGRPGDGADLFVTEWSPAGWSEPHPLSSINSSADELGPAFAGDGRTLYFHSDRPGGVGGYDLWSSRLEPDRDGVRTWSAPINLGGLVNTRFNEYGAAPTPGGETIYFSSNRPRDEASPADDDHAWRATLRARRTRHDYDLFASSSVDAEFREPLRLAINTLHDEGAPTVSPAGDFLWFASDRPGGGGGFDLYRCRILSRGGGPAPPGLGVVERLDDAINTPFDELDPTLAAEGFRVVFSSDRVREDTAAHEGARRFDLWTSVSREVELVSMPRPSLATVLRAIWPWLLSLVLLLALLLLLLHLLRSTAWRTRLARMSLFAQCLLASLAVHALLAFLLAVWQVGLGIGEFMRGGERGGGSSVLLASTGIGSAVLEQLFASPVSIDTERRELAAMSPLAAADAPARTAPDPAPLPAVENAAMTSAPSLPEPGAPAVEPRAPRVPGPPVAASVEPAVPSLVDASTLLELAGRAAPRGDSAEGAAPAPAPPALPASIELDSASVEAVERVLEHAAAQSGAIALEAISVPAALPVPSPAADARDAIAAGAAEAPSLALSALAPVPTPVSSSSVMEVLPALPERAPELNVASAPVGLPAPASLDLPEGAPIPVASFAHRAADQRAEILRATGGSEASEAAVARALVYFQRHQSPDGRWSSREFAAHGRDAGSGAPPSDHGEASGRIAVASTAACDCDAPAEVAMDVATTGLVLLCYLGAGHTHQSLAPDDRGSGAGLFHQQVSAGIRWLVEGQAPDGDLRRRRSTLPGGDTIYGHTIATVALCEAYAMTRDPGLVEPVRRAHAFLEQWSTSVRRGRGAIAPEDTSVLGWEIMALASARRAGLPVRTEAIAAARRWLDTVALDDAPGRYGYREGEQASVAMTAEALFVRQLLDELAQVDASGLDEPRERQSASFIVESLPENGDGTPAASLSHHWYYATLALHRRQGEEWRRWNATLAPLLIDRQRREGCAAGSWDPQDPWSRLGGRLYQTAICTLSLEVYYRYEARR